MKVGGSGLLRIYREYSRQSHPMHSRGAYKSGKCKRSTLDLHHQLNQQILLQTYSLPYDSPKLSSLSKSSWTDGPHGPSRLGKLDPLRGPNP